MVEGLIDNDKKVAQNCPSENDARAVRSQGSSRVQERNAWRDSVCVTRAAWEGPWEAIEKQAPDPIQLSVFDAGFLGMAKATQYFDKVIIFHEEGKGDEHYQWQNTAEVSMFCCERQKQLVK